MSPMPGLGRERGWPVISAVRLEPDVTAFIHDYGYSCHYDRQIKKRGRAKRSDKLDRVPETAASKSITNTPPSDTPNSQNQFPSPTEQEEDHVSPVESYRRHPIQRQPHSHAATSISSLPLGSPPGDTFSLEALNLQATRGSARQGQQRQPPAPTGLERIVTGCLQPTTPNDTQASRNSAQHRHSIPSIASSPVFNFTLPTPKPLHGEPNFGITQDTWASECRYRCLDPLMPYFTPVFSPSLACDLVDIFLVDPGTSLFRCASPYILTRIFRKKSLFHPTSPRQTSPALLATILWCCAQTADISALLVPGSRANLTNALYELATFLISRRDPDRWRRIHGGLRTENEQWQETIPDHAMPNTTESNEPVGDVDDVLTFLLLCIGVSASDFKSDSYKWWSKARRLAMTLRLNQLDASQDLDVGPTPTASLADLEAKEEKRRVFWLLFALDRHLALSFNRTLEIPDSICDVYAPLPENVWENLDEIPSHSLPQRVIGPPTIITGAGFFEYFLPLMVILGDIIETHHSQHHPRLGNFDSSFAQSVIKNTIANCEGSLERLAHQIELESGAAGTPMHISNLVTGLSHQDSSSSRRPLVREPTTAMGDRSHMTLVVAYSTFILHVLHVLLHGGWDPIKMLDNDDDWITTPRFAECASHAIAASEAVSDIIKLDPELNFMPYLFGIYLLHGSFILLLFADRMPQLGPNQSVEQACETIIRAHEVCVVTLSTEFQRNFRRVVRSTLYSVRGGSPAGREEHKAARRQILSLYRWTRGAKGLGI
ncbi:unnamed protein product [Clonostachys chloroleuca]|uniref:Xylanolytic transcriptional activator regulatory domain-containing protein n=1 Tax=Clonostachys chloroleuca TaxID=1926264 RepID=A0AA35Q6V7_9HYPO|nr:unnamed protein product [Clonostachys chloroleuca]